MISDFGEYFTRHSSLMGEVTRDLARSRRLQQMKSEIGKGGIIKVICLAEKVYRIDRLLKRLQKKNQPKMDEIIELIDKSIKISDDLQLFYAKEIEDKLEEIGIDRRKGLTGFIDLESKVNELNFEEYFDNPES